MVAKNKNATRKMTAKEEVIADSIEAIRKRIIQIQLECEFAERFINDNPDYGTEEAKSQLIHSVELMKKEEIALIAKLNFYKEKRTELSVKKAMRGYDRFPKTMTLDNAVLVEEKEK